MVASMKDRIAATEGLLLVTPEYNNSIPGVFKNAIDWLRGRRRHSAYSAVPVGIIGASPGRFGTLSSQTAWLPVLRSLGAQPWFGQSFYLGGAGRLFDASGALTDEDSRKRLQGYLAGFAEFVGATPRRR
jgi:NAD(P)H-dependent FMN reductase